MKDITNRSGLSRRDFVKSSVVATAGMGALMASGNYAYAAPRATLRVGLVGCGGRGKGAAADACRNEGVELVAMGDLFADNLAKGQADLQKALGTKYQVKPANAYSGWDSYKKVLASDIDYVILATSVVFRPEQFEAAIQAGKHVFMEKPVAVDPAGCRKIMELGELAQQKNLGVVAGTQRRHQAHYVEMMKRIHDGAIGDIVSGNVYWNQDGLWHRGRDPKWSDMEYQIRNWIYFNYLSGDHIVEQHIHNIDVANWALNSHPVKAIGLGGRQARTDEKYGNVFDHFVVVYEYPNGARVTSSCRQQDGTDKRIEEIMVGTKGESYSSFQPGKIMDRYDATKNWAFSGKETNPYVQEHADLIASIRAGAPLNEAHEVGVANLSAIMGREAAYTGLEITWDQIMASTQTLALPQRELGPLPVEPVAIPGVTKLDRTVFTPDAPTAATK